MATDLEGHYGLECRLGLERIAVHNQAPHKHAVVTQPEHHHGIPLGARTERKILIHLQDTGAGGGDPPAAGV